MLSNSPVILDSAASNQEKENQRVSIVIPVFNEGEAVSSFIEGLLAVISAHPEWDCSIIVVDDGSTDDTLAQLRKFPQITLLAHKHNRGYGAALKTGIKHSADNIIAIIDADSTYDPNDIFRLLPYIRQDDMVVGVRSKTGGSGDLMRRMARWIFCNLANFLTNTKIPDINSGLRIMDKTIINKYKFLLPDGFSFTTTITLAVMTNAYRVHFEPISYRIRVGHSKVKPFSDFSAFIYLILTTVLCFKPMRIFFPVSLLFIAGSLFILLFSYICLDKVMDITTILFFITGINLFATGLIAELFVRLAKERQSE